MLERILEKYHEVSLRIHSHKAVIGLGLFFLGLFASNIFYNQILNTNGNLVYANTRSGNYCQETYAGYRLQECLALKDFYYSTDGDNWAGFMISNTGQRGTGDDYCERHGIICSNATGSGAILSYATLFSALIGQLDPSGDLNTTYTDLSLSLMSIAGTLPNQTGHVIGVFSLANNLSGQLNASLTGLEELKIMILGYETNLTGSLPQERGSLDKMNLFFAIGTNLNGPIPSSRSGMVDMKMFGAISNKLTGPLPSSISTRNPLIFITMLNQIDGILPDSWSSWTGLLMMDLSYNLLTGTLPASWTGMESLVVLNLPYNQIGGSIPSARSDLENMISFDLSFNKLTGSLPSSFSSRDNISSFNVSYNYLDGNLPSSWSSWSGSISGFDAKYNNLTGSIPSSWISNRSLDMFSSAIKQNCLDLDYDSSEQTRLDVNIPDRRDQRSCYSTDLSISKSLISTGFDGSGNRIISYKLDYSNIGTETGVSVRVYDFPSTGLVITTGSQSFTSSGSIAPSLYITGGECIIQQNLSLSGYANEINDYFDGLFDEVWSYVGPIVDTVPGADKMLDMLATIRQIAKDIVVQITIWPTFDERYATYDLPVWIRNLLGFTDQSMIPDSCYIGGGSGYIFEIGDLSPGQTGSIVITGIVQSGYSPIINTGFIRSLSQETNISNNFSSVSTLNRGDGSCSNGATNRPECNQCESGQELVGGQCIDSCTNGANNPPSCNSCPSGQTLVGGQCIAVTYSRTTGSWGACSESCGTTGTQTRIVTCNSSTGGVVSDNLCSLTKPVETQDCFVSCPSCPSGQTLVNGQCVNNCTNGANNPPSCNTCPSGQILVGGQCINNPTGHPSCANPGPSTTPPTTSLCNTGSLNQNLGVITGGNYWVWFCNDGSSDVQCISTRTCPSGQIFDNNYNCIDASGGCPTGYQLQNNICVPITHSSPGGATARACTYNDADYLLRGPFTDTLSHRGFDYVESMRLSCLHRGRGTSRGLWIYEPNSSITRDEVLKTLVRILGMYLGDFYITSEDQTYNGNLPFVDVGSRYRFAHYADYAHRKGITHGLTEYSGLGTLIHPKRPITRNEAIRAMMIAYKSIYPFSTTHGSYSSSMLDVTNTLDPFYQYIIDAEILGFISGVPHGNNNYMFEGRRNITRAEFAKIISLPFQEILFDIQANTMNIEINTSSSPSIYNSNPNLNQSYLPRLYIESVSYDAIDKIIRTRICTRNIHINNNNSDFDIRFRMFEGNTFVKNKSFRQSQPINRCRDNIIDLLSNSDHSLMLDNNKTYNIEILVELDALNQNVAHSNYSPYDIGYDAGNIGSQDNAFLNSIQNILNQLLLGF